MASVGPGVQLGFYGRLYGLGQLLAGDVGIFQGVLDLLGNVDAAAAVVVGFHSVAIGVYGDVGDVLAGVVYVGGQKALKAGQTVNIEEAQDDAE